MRRASQLALLLLGVLLLGLAGCQEAIPFPDQLPLWLDCDGDGVDETRFSSDDCGACEVTCGEEECTETGSCICFAQSGDVEGAVGAGPACQSMGPGFRCCTEGCLNVLEDPLHCGACGVRCEAFFRSTGRACSDGACAIPSCQEGWADCDGIVENGCEVDLRNDDGNCGACGQTCELSEALPFCVGGACVSYFCQPGHGDCDGLSENGCETPLDGSDLLREGATEAERHCGRCGEDCQALAHVGEVTCVANAAAFGCEIASCEAGYGDCDGLAQNGCEASLDSVERCGSCDQACVLDAHSSVTCARAEPGDPSTAECTIAGCFDRYADCVNGVVDGCESDLSGDREHCGDCGYACSPSARACTDGACLRGLRQISAGGTVCAVTDAGAVLCWGLDQRTPATVPGLTDAVQVSVGSRFACAVTGGGAVHCWGENNFGQLGDGGRVDHDAPSPVIGITDAVEVAAGGLHACARLSSGEVRCWGNGAQGELGDGSGVASETPVAVAGLSDALQLAAGSSHTCARRAGGVPVCWGRNYDGQLGTGDTADRLTPAPVAGLGVPAHITAGFSHTCASFGSGWPFCWGDNFYGQLGEGGSADRLNPWPIMSSLGGIEIFAGGWSTCLTSGPTLECWGSNDGGYLVDGEGSMVRTPVEVDTTIGSVVNEVAVGANFACFLAGGGAAWCWGRNDRGVLGDGGLDDRAIPELAYGMAAF